MFDLSEKTEAELWELTSAENLEARAEAVMELGVRCLNDERNVEASSLFSTALDLWIQVGDKTGIGRANFANGVYHVDEERFAEGIPYLIAAASCYQFENRTSWEAEALWRLAIAYRGLDEVELQKETLKQSIAASVSIDEFVKASHGENELGNALCLQNKQEEGLAAFTRALEYAQLAEDPILCLKAQNMKAMAMVELGDHDKALANLRLNLDSALYLGDDELIAIIKNDLGQTLIEVGLYEQGLELVTPQSSRWKAAKLFDSAIGVDIARVEALIGLQRFDEAQELLKQLESITTSMDKTNKLASVFSLWAELLMKQGQSELAYDYFTKSIKFSEEADKSWIARESTLSLAKVLVDLGEFDKSLELLSTLSVEEAGDARMAIARMLACHAQASALQGDFAALEQDVDALVDLGDHFGFWHYQAAGFDLMSEMYSRQGDEKGSSNYAEIAHKVREKYESARGNFTPTD